MQRLKTKVGRFLGNHLLNMAVVDQPNPVPYPIPRDCTKVRLNFWVLTVAAAAGVSESSAEAVYILVQWASLSIRCTSNIVLRGRRLVAFNLLKELEKGIN